MSQKPRKVVKVVSSGAPSLYPDVDIYDSTLDHIEEGHPEAFDAIEDVYSTIEQPDRIHRSLTNPRSVLLVNEGVTTESGTPLRVAVKVVSDTEAILSSAYFASTSGEGELLYAKTNEPDTP